jgi:hypothetical protein
MLIAAPDDVVDFVGEGIEITITAGEDMVFRTVLAPNSVQARSASAFKMSQRAARTGGGVAVLKVKRVVDGYRFTVKAYGALRKARADMIVHVTVGGRTWSSHGLWSQINGGWRLTDDALLP